MRNTKNRNHKYNNSMQKWEVDFNEKPRKSDISHRILQGRRHSSNNLSIFKKISASWNLRSLIKTVVSCWKFLFIKYLLLTLCPFIKKWRIFFDQHQKQQQDKKNLSWNFSCRSLLPFLLDEIILIIIIISHNIKHKLLCLKKHQRNFSWIDFRCIYIHKIKLKGELLYLLLWACRSFNRHALNIFFLLALWIYLSHNNNHH